MYGGELTSHLHRYEYSRKAMPCGNWNQGNSENDEDDLKEDRRSVVRKQIGQFEMCSCETGPMTSELLLQHSPLQNDHRRHTWPDGPTDHVC